MMRPYIRDRLAFQDRAGFKPAPTIWPCMREAGRHPTATTGREEIRSSIMQRREPGRRSMRLSGHDYSTPGAYFITACTHNRLLLFGRVVNGKMAANRLGAAVEDCWAELPDHYDNVALDAFILMPNHVHGVIIIQDAPTGVGAGLQPARPEDGPTGVGAGLQPARPEDGPTGVGAGLQPARPEDGPTGVGAGLQPARPEDGPTGVGAGLQPARPEDAPTGVGAGLQSPSHNLCTRASSPLTGED